MLNKVCFIFFLFFFSARLFAQFSLPFKSPFKWEHRVKGDSLFIEVEIPPKHYLYLDTTSVKLFGASGKEVKPEKVPESVVYKDKLSGEKHKIFESGKAEWIFKTGADFPYKAQIKFQGCRKEPFVCFPPGSESFEIGGGQKTASGAMNSSSGGNAGKKTDRMADLMEILNRFKIESSGGGYLSSHEFLAFLDEDKKAQAADYFGGKGFLWMVFLILVGGIALNLTPCVLPMIPINLAIIGAGSGASRFSGFARGGVYGAGIAFVYGALGLLVVLTGARFGFLNSTWWFNFIIALVFIILGLAMFDVVSIDFSKYGSKINPSESQKGKLLTAFVLGGVAALLGGACVAPVVLAVMIHSSSLYSNGNYLGLFLPFVLGIGMALPWPVAGAGLSVMPKPGKWMVRIKQSMGVFIFLAAAYYAYQGYALIPSSAKWTSGAQLVSLRSGLLRAEREKKPVFIDFWATWCSACRKMEASTFKDPEVEKELHNFVVIKFQAERPSNDDVSKILNHFKVVGFPSYVILSPQGNSLGT